MNHTVSPSPNDRAEFQAALCTFRYGELATPAHEASVYLPQAELDALRVTHGGPLYGAVDSGASITGAGSGLPLIGWASCGHPPARVTDGMVWLTIDGAPEGNPGVSAWIGRSGGWTACVVRVYGAADSVCARHGDLLVGRELADKTVLVVGAGSWGAPTAIWLAQQGVGRFILFDHDALDPANLGRSVLDAADLGRPKATALAEKLARTNPEAEIEVHVANVLDPASGVAAAISRSDVVACAADSLLARHYLNLVCVAVGTPIVLGASYHRGVAAEVIHVVPGLTSCLECIHPGEVHDDVARSELAYADDPQGPAPIPGLSIDILEGVTLFAGRLLALLAGPPRAETLLPHECNRLLRHAGLVPSDGFELDFAHPWQVLAVEAPRDAAGCPTCGDSVEAVRARTNVLVHAGLIVEPAAIPE